MSRSPPAGASIAVVQPSAPSRGGLGENMIKSLVADDIEAVSRWLRDPGTHLEDTSDEASRCQTAVMWCSRNGASRCLRLLLDAGADKDATMADVGATALYLATQNGHEQCVRQLLRAGANANIARNTGTTALAVAAKQNFFQIVFLLIQAGARVDCATVQGVTPVLVAAKAGSAESLTQLVRAGADVNCRALDGLTPLIAAAISGDIRCITALLDARAHLDSQLPEGATAIFTLARSGNVQGLRMLIDAGADVNMRCRDGSTALIVAAQKAQTECLRALLDAGARVDSALAIGATALYVAAQEGYGDCVQILLDAGAQPNAARTTGASAIFAAAQQGHTDCVQKLLHGGANASCTTDAGLCLSTLCAAVQNGHENCARLLIEGGANVHTLLRDGSTALFLTAEKGLEVTMRRLLEAGASPNVTRVDGTTALGIARAGGHTSCENVLREAGVVQSDTKTSTNPSARLEEQVIQLVQQDQAAALNVRLRGAGTHIDDFEPSKCQTALILAARHGSGKCMQTIIDHGANLNATMKQNATALYIATQQGFKGCMRLLLQAGANPNLSREGGVSALYVAAQKCRLDCVELLLSCGANVNSAKEDMKSALHCVVQSGQPDSVRQLIKAGAHIDIAAHDGTTALHIAAQHSEIACLRLLIEGGAYCNAVTAQGVSPLYLAAKAGNADAVRKLIEGKASVQLARANGYTPLMAAVHGGSVECTELVLAQDDVDCDVATTEGVSALVVATQRSQHMCMRALLEAGAKPDAEAGALHTPLTSAVECDDEQAAAILIRAGCDVNRTSANGATPLIAAVRRGNGTLVKLLLGAGADVNTLSNEAGSALLVAVSEGRKDLLRMLLAAGCVDAVFNPSAESPLAGRTALDFALDTNNQSDVVQLLREAGAVAPTLDPKSLVGKRVVVEQREGVVIGVEDKSAFGLTVADRNVKFKIEFVENGELTPAKESVKLLRGGPSANNGGSMYKIVGQLSATGTIKTDPKQGIPPSSKDATALLDKSGKTAVVPRAGTSQDECVSTSTASHKDPINSADDHDHSGTNLPPAVISDSEPEDKLRQMLEAFYGVHNAEMLEDSEQMNKVVRYYATRVDELNSALVRQYGYDLQSPLPAAVEGASLTGGGMEVKSMEQAILNGHAAALLNLLQNGTVVPPQLREDAALLLERAEQAELEDAEETHKEWERRMQQCLRKVNEAGEKHKKMRTEQQRRASEETTTAQAAREAYEEAPPVDKANDRVTTAQAKVTSLAGQLNGHTEGARVLREEIERLQRQLADVEAAQASTAEKYAQAKQELDDSKAAALDAEVKQDTAKRQLERHQIAVQKHTQINQDTEQARMQHATAEEELDQVRVGLQQSIVARDNALHMLQNVSQCLKRIGQLGSSLNDTTDGQKRKDDEALDSGVDVGGTIADNSKTHQQHGESAAVVDMLLSYAKSYSVQRAGLALLVEYAQVPDNARVINAHNGQQLLLFNVFRALLGTDIERLRELLSASRLQNVASISAAIDAAVEIQNISALVTVLCAASATCEPILQLRGMTCMLELMEAHDTALTQLQEEPDERRRLRSHSQRLQEECPLQLELCAAATRIIAFLDAFDDVNGAQDVQGIVQALVSCAAPPRALLQFIARKCLQDLGLVKAATSVEVLKSLKVSLSDGHQLEGPTKHLHGVLEVAEWIVQSDASAGGSNGWLAAHLNTLLEHDVNSLAQAKRLIEDYGDLREWKIPKVAAKALFASLEELSLRQL